MTKSPIQRQPALEVAGVIVPWTRPSERPTQDRLDETDGLVAALNCNLAFLRPEHVRNPSPAYLLSGGLLDRLHDDVVAHGCSMVVIDSALSPIQQRNLENRLEVKVIDRTGLILEIFGLRALTKEGRLQVELARLTYERSRLVRTWTHLERQRGGSGFLGGPGETQLESDKRMIDGQVERLKLDLDAVRRTRSLQRAGRRRRGVPVVALVGYTNSGKSTLFNRLSGADVLAKDMPFATLDPTIRRLDLPTLGEAALVDTVGFITDLPTHLIDSFRATLEETLDADLIVHVRDRASEADEDQKQDVITILNQLSESQDRPLPPLIEASNKIDLLADFVRDSLADQAAAGEDVTGVPVSALNGTGMNELLAAIETRLGDGRRAYFLELASSDGALHAWLHQNIHLDAETFAADGGVRYLLNMSVKDMGRLRSAFPAARPVLAPTLIPDQVAESRPT